MLDTYVVDVASRFVLYMVLVLLLGEMKLVHPLWLASLIVAEIVLLSISFESESKARRSEFHYEFVLDRGAGRRLYGITYPIQVVTGHLTAYNLYCLLPLVTYIWPLSTHGRTFFFVIWIARVGTLVWKLRAVVRRTAQASM
jgi:hypothetical protein